MDFEKMKLPDFVIADLYKDCLVELENNTQLESNSRVESKPKVESFKKIENNQEVEEQPADKTKLLKFLGNNRKNISLLINEETSPIVNDKQLAFITKLLIACNLSLDDIAIINYHKNPVSFSELQQQMKVSYVLLFGVEPSEIKLPFTIPHFQVQSYAGCTFIYTPALTELLPETNESRTMKRKLWESLKSAFNL